MKILNSFVFVLSTCFLLASCNQPKCVEISALRSADLKETGKNQRRDLSLPLSRIVINFYDFKSNLTAAEYSNRATLPLNLAYLSTDKNIKGKDSMTRFCRSVTDLLTVQKSKEIQKIINGSLIGQAISFETEWTPHALPFIAEYTGEIKVNGFDYLYDENTVVRKLNFSKNSSGFSFSGSYRGKISFIDDKIIVNDSNIRYCIMFSCLVKNFVFTDNNWGVIIDEKTPNKSVVISIAFADRGESVEQLVSRAEKPIIDHDVDRQLSKREKYWDNFLAKVPHPVNFEFSKVNSNGVTPEELKQAYYKAWIFTAQNVLPEDKEIYPYPQICTGKPSLWDEGEKRAPFSAAWESFIGIQLYSYIDPELSWKAFKGLLSLVDEDGMLGGESLPSRKAQTAMILYSQTDDKVSLEEVYPALKRYLNWRMRITHWVYGELYPSGNFKDADFAFSALVDMEYMGEIAKILGKDEDVIEWRKKHNEFSKKCLEWFWETPFSKPDQYYNTETKERNKGNTIWVTTGFHVNNLLYGDYEQSMIDLIRKEYNPESKFAGLNHPKYPDISYTVYGLLEHGLDDRALGILEANLRDIVKANSFFAEDYIGDNYQPAGVRPSLFGSSTLIDFTWLLNGYRYDRGTPYLVLLGNKTRGIKNIHIKGEAYELRIIDPDNKVYWGKSSMKLNEITPTNLKESSLNSSANFKIKL